MGRIEEGFRRRFRELLARVRPRRLDFGVELLMRRARERAAREGLGEIDALTRLYEEVRVRVERRLKVMAACAVSPPPPVPSEAPPPFVCDASLGGLARWLRAAGYDAAVTRRAGDVLVREARAAGGVLLTTDARLWDRKAIRDGVIPALWVPSGLDVVRQLGMVLRDLGLSLREPRCMPCGGRMEPVEKAEVADRIPPRTARWLDTYFVCGTCGRLFWRGTHWERIEARLRSC